MISFRYCTQLYANVKVLQVRLQHSPDLEVNAKIVSLLPFQLLLYLIVFKYCSLCYLILCSSKNIHLKDFLISNHRGNTLAYWLHWIMSSAKEHVTFKLNTTWNFITSFRLEHVTEGLEHDQITVNQMWNKETA